MSVFKACVSSKNNTTIYVCVGEDVTLSCPPAAINKTVSWFRNNVSKNPVIKLYQGHRGKDNHLPSNIAVDVNEEKGESNLTINNFTKADTGSYQCLHDKSLTSWVFYLTMKACVSSKNNTTIYVCVGEDVTLSCPPAAINKTVSWFRNNVSKNPVIKLYQGHRGKDNHLPSNIAVDVNEEKGESNLTINNFTKADTGSYQCLHDKTCVSSKNNTTIYVCVGEDVTLPCPPAGISKTVSWFRKIVSKNPIIKLYLGHRGKDNHLPSNIAVDVNEEKGESNLTINNFTKADTGSYQCLHDKSLTSWVSYLIMKDCTIKNNDSEPTTTVIPQCSGDAVKGFFTKDITLYGVIVVLLVLVLIIVSLFGHAYIQIQYKQTNFPVPLTDVVRHSPVQIEMQEVSNNEEDPHEESRNLQLLSEIVLDLQNAASNDKQSDLSKTNTSQSSSLSNRSQNINEEDYLHPYHGFVHSGMDVHEYATVGMEYEEIIETSKNESK
ncbi:unnamed protein product [Mytilus coruscus]|uniref:Ig-like domain-containing protein n=1 Tax=Mytilus coruscus TaxID=42192 RepID=A0A6J8BSE9_MYTCO|nr:unnamed protein product [Mytilus coruscus]